MRQTSNRWKKAIPPNRMNLELLKDYDEVYYTHEQKQ